MKERFSTVAVVRSNNRRGAVAEALALISHEIAEINSEVMVLPDLGATRSRWAWTRPDTLSATLDALFSVGANRAVIHASNFRDLDRSQLRLETFGRPVHYPSDSVENEHSIWKRVKLDLDEGVSMMVRDIKPRSLVSIATMKTDGTSTVGFSLANLLNLIHPDDRFVLGLNQPKIDKLLRSGWIKVRGRARRFWDSMNTKDDLEAWRRLNPRAISLLQAAERTAHLIATLANSVRPVVSLVDGFKAMHREGPDGGEAVDLGVIIAGVDPVAVDAVSAAIMGFDPAKILHLRHANAEGIGQVNLEAITIVGDSLESVRKRCIPHSNQRVLKHSWRLPGLIPLPNRGSIVPPTHARPVRSVDPSRR